MLTVCNFHTAAYGMKYRGRETVKERHLASREIIYFFVLKQKYFKIGMILGIVND
jgi:hypothetical protein